MHHTHAFRPPPLPSQAANGRNSRSLDGRSPHAASSPGLHSSPLGARSPLAPACSTPHLSAANASPSPGRVESRRAERWAAAAAASGYTSAAAAAARHRAPRPATSGVSPGRGPRSWACRGPAESPPVRPNGYHSPTASVATPSSRAPAGSGMTPTASMRAQVSWAWEPQPRSREGVDGLLDAFSPWRPRAFDSPSGLGPRTPQKAPEVPRTRPEDLPDETPPKGPNPATKGESLPDWCKGYPTPQGRIPAPIVPGSWTSGAGPVKVPPPQKKEPGAPPPLSGNVNGERLSQRQPTPRSAAAPPEPNAGAAPALYPVLSPDLARRDLRRAERREELQAAKQAAPAVNELPTRPTPQAAGHGQAAAPAAKDAHISTPPTPTAAGFRSSGQAAPAAKEAEAPAPAPQPETPLQDFSVTTPRLGIAAARRPMEELPPSLRGALNFIRALPALPCTSLGNSRPFLPSQRPELDGRPPRPTLVLDLDETLVHCHRPDSRGARSASSSAALASRPADLIVQFDESSFGNVHFRPFVHFFLKVASKAFELVVFTASQQSYADKVIDALDPTGAFISHRLYRQHCTELRGAFFKELPLLGRPMSQCILVDNSPISVACNADNGVLCRSWYGERQDQELMELLAILQDLRAQGGDVGKHLARRYGLSEFFGTLREDAGRSN